jgi:hypothetical protein
MRVNRLPLISPAKTLLAALLVLSAVALSVARPAAAATPCWKALLNDWYDGRIDHTYALHCYTDALKHLPPDVKQYSSAHDDIERALQSAIAAKTKSGGKVNANTQIPPPSASSTTTTSAVTTSHTTTSSSGGGTSTNGDSGGTTTTTGVGRASRGGLLGLADKLNPGSADSLPLPLIVLGILAAVLVAAGAAGLIAKRMKRPESGA